MESSGSSSTALMSSEGPREKFVSRNLTCCSAWMAAADLCSYEENRGRFSQPKRVRGFAEAIWEVEEDPDLVITLGRPPSKRRRRSQPNRDQEGACEVVLDKVTCGECVALTSEGVLLPGRQPFPRERVFQHTL